MFGRRALKDSACRVELSVGITGSDSEIQVQTNGTHCEAASWPPSALRKDVITAATRK